MYSNFFIQFLKHMFFSWIFCRKFKQIIIAILLLIISLCNIKVTIYYLWHIIIFYLFH